jgi:hypothetical protein
LYRGEAPAAMVIGGDREDEHKLLPHRRRSEKGSRSR